ncbi:hypothetical protein [Streptomyces subrutilus]|uniref:Uncharacterized protein n=1 Tax=Streptomyces subrutilus TaxID=36818 RepID=A0A1E5NXA8_9ACTN|nr:hypothetical protein [Streptomyces subrutilus]OEJ20884.1 hypothetical protein BGK67_35190 [Streptomyces subrutilus]
MTEAGSQTLALTTGAELYSWIAIIAGNIFLIVLIVRAVGHYAKREWGELVGHVITGVIVAGFVFATEATKNMFVEIWTKVAGA